MNNVNKPEQCLNNKLSPSEIKLTIDEFSDRIRWRTDGFDTLLDIGCGPGNITHDQLIPFLPVTFTRIVGADISTEMLDFAKSHYSHPKLTFSYMNIEDENIGEYVNEQFDHITAFFLFHFIKNQNLAMKNIYNLLNENGDCLFITFGYNSVFEALIKMYEMEKWSKYMYDYETYISPYQKLPNKKEAFENVLIAGGFPDYTVNLVDKSFSFKLQSIKDLVMSACGIYDRIPKDLQSEWLDEVIRLGCPMSDITKPDSDFSMTYTLILAYARK